MQKISETNLGSCQRIVLKYYTGEKRGYLKNGKILLAEFL
jgi:hypothetical protein